MTSYDRRKKEVKDRFQHVQAGMNAPEIVRVTAVLEEYFNQRDHFLTTVTATVADDGNEELIEDHRSEFTNLTRQIESTLGDMLSGLSDVSDAALRFREQTLVEDVRFHYSLAAADPVATRDVLVALELRLREKIKVLEEKWAKLSDEDRRIEEIEFEAARRMTAAVKEAIEAEAGIHLQVGNTVSAFIDKVAKYPDEYNDAIVHHLVQAGVPEEYAKLVPKVSDIGKAGFDGAKQLGIPAKEYAKILSFVARDPGMWLSDTFRDSFGPEISMLLSAIGEARKALQTLQGRYSEQLSVYKNQLPNQGSCLVVLSNGRRDVDDFIKNNGVDVARSQLDKGLSALERLGSEPPTEGLKGDGADVARAMAEALRQRFDQVEDVFDVFVSQNRGRFLGPISDQTEQALLRPGSWQEIESGLTGLGLDEKLRSWRASTLEVTSRMSSAFSQIQGSFAQLPVDLQDKVRRATNETWDQAQRMIGQGAQEAVATIDVLEPVARAEQVHKDLDRSALATQLRA